MTDKYELNEKDIESVIRFLKIHDPANATPEKAIAMLEDLQTFVHTMSHENPELLEKLYAELKDGSDTSNKE